MPRFWMDMLNILKLSHPHRFSTTFLLLFSSSACCRIFFLLFLFFSSCCCQYLSWKSFFCAEKYLKWDKKLCCFPRFFIQSFSFHFFFLLLYLLFQANEYFFLILWMEKDNFLELRDEGKPSDVLTDGKFRLDLTGLHALDGFSC